jgi:Fur family ferric uptake transcriptional regulator
MDTARDTSGALPRIGQRTTKQRTAVVEALAELTSFTSAQDIHSALTTDGRKVGLTTVYRTLQQLTAAGMVDTLQDDSGEMLYRSCTTDHHHHHLVCTSCRKTVEIDGGPVESWAATVAAEHGFTVTGHTADVFGLCPDCANR